MAGGKKLDYQAIKRVFEKAILKGHFILRSQRHSDTYVEKAYLCKDPLFFDDLCGEIALEVYSKGIEVDVVVGPAPIGAIISCLVAYHLQELYRQVDKFRKVEFLFTEKNKEGQHNFRPAFCKTLAGKRILLVDDVLTEGTTMMEFLKALAYKNGVQVAGVAVLCNRGGFDSIPGIGIPIISLLKFKLKSWSAEDCPLCKQGIPITRMH